MTIANEIAQQPQNQSSSVTPLHCPLHIALCSQFGGFAFLSCTKRTQLTAGQSVKIVIVLGGAGQLSEPPSTTLSRQSQTTDNEFASPICACHLQCRYSSGRAVWDIFCPHRAVPATPRHL
jgi:hypothetical protein